MKLRLLKRILAMTLTVCMVLSLCPVSAFAAEVGDTTTTIADVGATAVAPEAAEGTIWLHTNTSEPYHNITKCDKVEHLAHSNDCYSKNCDHASATINGHLQSCYGSGWCVCTHTDETQHSGATSINKDINLQEVNDELLEYLKDLYGYKVWEAHGKTFCYSINYNNLSCTHVCSEVGGACYELSAIKGCPGYIHPHTDECKSVTHTWTLYADLNKNGTDDATEASYTVSFDSNGGSVVESQTILTGLSATEPSTTRDGWKFAGWYESGAEAPYDFSKAVTADISLTATWKPIVSFDSNGGSEVESQTVEVGGTATQPADPTREWHTFNGWFNGTEKYVFTTPVTAPVALKADWTEYGVSVLSMNDGSIPYEQHINPDWSEEANFKTNLSKILSLSLSVDGKQIGDEEYVDDNITYYQVTTDGNDQRVETELTSVYDISSNAGATLTVFAKLAETDAWQTAQSADVTLTLVKEPGQNTISLGSLFGASLVVEVNGSVVEFSNNTIALSKVDGNTGDSVEITVTANDGYYLDNGSVTVTGTTATPVVAEDKKTATVTFTANNYDGQTYTIGVNAAAKAQCVIDLKTTALSIDEADISEDAIQAKYTDAYIKELFISSVDNGSFGGVEVNVSPAITGITGDSMTYNISFNHAGNNTVLSAEEKHVSLTLNDARPASTINVNENGVVYLGENISAAEVLEKLFVSVTAGEDTVLSALDTGLVSISGLQKKTLWWNDADAVTDEGTYRATISYAGSNTHKASELKQYEFTVTDGREATSLSYTTYEVKIKGTNPVSYTVPELMKAMGFAIKSTDGTLIINYENYVDYGVSVEVKKYDLSKVDLVGTAVTVVDTAGASGIYRINVEFPGVPGENGYKPCETSGVADPITVVDARPQTAIALQSANPSLDTLEAELSVADVLKLMSFSLNSNGSAVLTYENYTTDSNLTVSITDADSKPVTSVTETGTYTVAVSYAENNKYFGCDTTVETLTVTDGRLASSVTINNSDSIEYDTHNAAEWRESWKSNIISAMGITVKDNDDELMADAEVKLYTVTDGAETELTAYPGSGTFTVRAKFAGNNEYKFAVSADATLTLVEAPGASTIVKGDVSNAEIIVTVDGEAAPWSATGTISVPYKSVAVIKVTAVGDYYLTEYSIKVNGETFANGGSVEAEVYEGQTFTVSASAVEKTASSISVNASYEDKPADLSKISYSKADMVAFFAPSVDVEGAEIIITGFESINAIGDAYTISFSYAGNETTKASTATAILKVSDGRPETQINVNQNVEIGYVGNAITEADILKAVVASVSTVDGVEIEDAQPALVSGALGAIYKETISNGYNLGYITPMGSAIGGGSFTDELLGDVTGNFKVTVSYSGDANLYRAAENVDVYFSVYDNRDDINVVVSDVTKEHGDLSNISYGLSEIEEAFGARAQLAKDGTAIENASISIVSVKKEGSGLFEYVYNTIGSVNNLPITEEGVYTVVFQCADSNTWKKGNAEAVLTIVDARAEGNLVLKEDHQFVQDSKVFEYTQDELLDALFEGVDTGAGEYYIPNEGISYTFYKDTRTEDETEPVWTLVEANITEFGIYKLSVSFSGDNTHKEVDEASTTFSITDSRPQPKFALGNTVIPFDFEDFSKEKLVEALEISCEEDGLSYSRIRILVGEEEVEEEDLDIGCYTVEISFDETDDYNANLQLFDIEIIDARGETKLEINDVSIEYTGNPVRGVDIIDKMLKTLVDENGEDISYELGGVFQPGMGELLIFSEGAEGEVKNAGEYEFTVVFTGDAYNKPAQATATLTITKANASVSVTGTTTRWTGYYDINNMISSDPAGAKMIRVAAGIDLGEARMDDLGITAYVDVPYLTDNADVNNMLSQYLKGGTMTVEEMTAMFRTAIDAMENDLVQNVAGYIGVNIDTDGLNKLVDGLERIAELSEVENLTVKLSFGQGTISIPNSGLYIVGAMVSDSNCESDMALNYLLLTPDGYKADIQWKIADENGLFTIGALRNGYDLSAEVTKVYEGNIEDAAAALTHIFIGVDMNGDPVIIRDQMDLTLGAYTQIAYFENLGNVMYYADPIVRPVVVVSDVVEVKFDDANENNVRVFDWVDNTKQTMTAKVYDRSGDLLDDAEQAKITYKYIGMESDGEFFSSTDGAERPGVYTVIATYIDGVDPERVGMAVGEMIILPREATISVDDAIGVYGQDSFKLADLITKEPADAKQITIVAGIANVGDFSENGLAAVEGQVLVDLPDRVESALKQLQNQDVFTADQFKALLAPLGAAMEAVGMDISSITAIEQQLRDLPGTVSVRVTDLSSYEFVDMGAWVVIGGIMDNDYVGMPDMGLVVLHPEVNEYVLTWNYDDANGIITRPVLASKDLLANAGEGNNEITAQIKYLVYGVSDEGETVMLSSGDADFEAAMKALPNGIYTQLAYIEPQIDATIPVAAPIMRQFILSPQNVTVDAPDVVVTYGKDFDYTVTVTKADGTVIDDPENLTVKFIGFNAIDDGYYRETVPTNAGVYAVFAQYKTVDENGKLDYFGVDAGTLTIEPARLNYDVKDVEYRYDGEAKKPLISNPHNASDILFIVDTQNATVNVVAPSLGVDKDPNYNWDGDIHIQYWLEELNKAIEQLNSGYGVDVVAVIDKLVSILPEEITNSDTYNDIVGVLSDIRSDVLTLNTTMPTEPGKYNVYAIAYKDPNHAIELSEGNITITKGYPIRFVDSDNPAMIAAGASVRIGSLTEGDEFVLDEACLAWVEERWTDESNLLILGYEYEKDGKIYDAPTFAYDENCRGLYLWKLEWNEAESEYHAKRVTDLDNNMSFGGASIWAGGTAGINGIGYYYNYNDAATAAWADLGYKVREHGTVVAWADKLAEGEAPTLRADRSNSAAGHASLGMYWNSTYNIRDSYIPRELRVSFYTILEDAEGAEIIVYGGSVNRSIGYVAWQNDNIDHGAYYNRCVDELIAKAGDAVKDYEATLNPEA